jgi:xylulokinase
MGYLMGIDIGTSSVKAIIIDRDGHILTLAKSSGHNISCLHSGWAEQDPNDWWHGCRNAITGALSAAGINPDKIDCIGLSGQMHSLVSLDQNFNLVRTAILHCDSRSGQQAKYLAVLLGGNDSPCPEERGMDPHKIHILQNQPYPVRSAAGLVDSVKNPIHTGYTLPSLMWIRDNEPAVYERIRHILLPVDYIRLRLTGEYGTDHSNASATLAYDFLLGRWSDTILNLANIPMDLFPTIHHSAEVAGKVTKAAAAETGLCTGIPVVFGGGDQVMQSIGSGSIEAGQATVNIGSGGQVCIQVDRLLSNPEAGVNCFCSYKSNKWYLMGANSNGGSAFKWFCNEILQDSNYGAIDEQVENIPGGCDGLLFLPYLSGERCPLLNAGIGGVFWGLSYLTNRARMARAVMEGIAFSLYDCLLACESTGISPKKMIALGGGANSRVWLQIQADIYGKPLVVTMNPEQAALGAAITAGVGSGAFRSFEEGCGCFVHYGNTIEPNFSAHSTYLEYFDVYKNIYKLARPALEAATILGRRNN